MLNSSIDINTVEPHVLVIYENAIVSTGSVKQPFKISPPMLLMRYCGGILVPLVHEVIFNFISFVLTYIMCMYRNTKNIFLSCQ